MFSSFKERLLRAISQITTNKIKLWKTITLFSIVLFLFAISLFIWHITSRKQDPSLSAEEPATAILTQENQSSPACDDCVRRRLDGVWVKEVEANLPPIAVMIDNHPSARPPKGLDKAGLVYEAEVEGNYTRYMAVFSAADGPEEIGPVRSARSYFLDWAAELGAVYSHCGGSPEALVRINQKGIPDLNEFYNGQYFWRDSKRSAPHNVTTSWTNLKKYLENKNIENGDFSVWRFKDDGKNKDATSSKIIIPFNHPDFRVEWHYNEQTNDYERYLGGSPEYTEDRVAIKAKNILIQTIPAKVVDEKLRLAMNPIGQGPATICLDGLCEVGEWKKNGFHERTIFYSNNGQEVELNAGQTWVEVVRPEIIITY
jgi:hypothetical protein